VVPLFTSIEVGAKIWLLSELNLSGNRDITEELSILQQKGFNRIYVVEHDKSPERKANLSQLDVKFARVIMRVQHEIEVGLETIAKRHLAILGFPQSEINSVKVNLPDPSDMFTKRRLDVDEQKTRVVQAVKGLMLFPDSYIYKEYFEMTDKEVEQIKKEMEQQTKEQMEQQAAMQPPMPGAPPPAGAPPAPAPAMPPNGSTPPNGIESQENMPPTAPPQEAVDLLSDFKKDSILTENIEKALVFDRIIKKYNTKLKNLDK
jgi:hypothetical protein